MKRTRKNQGYTLIEVMLVVLMIATLLSIAVPNFIRTREQARAKSCSRNIKYIDGAKEQWAIDNRKNSNDTPSFTDLVGNGSYLKATPTCPSGGVYTLNPVGTHPVCNRNNPPVYPHTFNNQQ
jgi:prepilin-type N-terminal cleavage/methylation domain-containing protein